jgi:hypothetical protein
MSRVIASSVVIAMIVGGLAAPAGWAQTTKGAGTETKPAPTSKAASQTEKVDLNSATQKELEALPGVGPATAKKIIEGRPYSSTQDLAKAGVSAKTIEKLSPMVVVGAATTGAPASRAPAVSSAPQKPALAKSGEAKSVEAKVPPAKGMVWVNTKSGIFHVEGDRWYGKTKEGKFMTEAEALKAGYRASKEGTTKKEDAAKQ